MNTLKLTLFALFILIFSCADEEKDVNSNKDIPKIIQTQSVVFITGIDEDDATFYKNTKAYFSQQQITIVEDVNSIEDIILWLNAHADDKYYENIHIVSQSNAWRGISLNTRKEGERNTLESLNDMPFIELNKGITEKTDIIFYSCGLAANKKLMKALKRVFSSAAAPNLYASEYFNIFGGKYASHYLAQPFYVFYPTAHSPGNKVLSEELAHDYPSAGFDWLAALETQEETTAGATYSYLLYIPVDWDILFDDSNEIPNLETTDDIMDFILETNELSLALHDLGIPMDKFQWESEVHENVLKIKGSSTVVCVLNPVMDTYIPAEYTFPDYTHPRLYTKF